MPRRKADTTRDDGALTPESGGEAIQPDSTASDSTLPDSPQPDSMPPEPRDVIAEEPLPVPGAESEREPAPEPPADPVETVTVDQVPPEAEPAYVAAPVVQDEPAEEHTEEEGRSLAARVLTALLLLLAGAALGIWAAPKVAPLLPSGLQPVAEWLTPGRGQAEADLAALQARLDEGLGGVEQRFAGLASGEDVDSRIGAAVQSAETRLAAEIGALQQAVNASDDTETSQRLARVESSVEGQAAELATLKEQLSGSTAASGQITEEAVARIDVYRAELDGLRAEMGTVQDKVAALATRIDEVASEAERQIQTAQTKVGEIQTQANTALTAAEVDADVALIRAAVASGLPFQEPLDRLVAHAGAPLPDGLTAAAATGVATMPALRDSYPDAAHAAIRAGIMAGAGDGVLARSRAFLAAQVASRSLTPQAGMTPDAVLSRMEARLRQDDLQGVLDESAQLPSEAEAAMAGWLDAARLRANAVAGLATLNAAGQ